MLKKINGAIFVIAVITFAAAMLFDQVISPYGNRDVAQQQQVESSHAAIAVPKSGIHTLMGKTERQVQDTLGKPERVDLSRFGYRWLIYGRASEQYMQIGVDNASGRVATIYVLGNKIKTNPFSIGEPVKNMFTKNTPASLVSLNSQGSQIDFELNEDDLATRPLMKFGKIWIQLNIDHVTGHLIAVRYMTADVLALQHPYSITYRGKLPEPKTLSGEEWAKVNQGEDQEIFDLSNILRLRFGKKMLTWDGAAHQAAYQHSKEMKVKNYFSHESKWSGNLKDRLYRQNIQFQWAGENIAAHYPDAAAVTLGWLNSPDHRKNLLNGTFTKLGVGSYQNYYTQDFVTPVFP